MARRLVERTRQLGEKTLALFLCVLLSVLSFLALPQSSQAADLSGESLTLSDPRISQASVTYTMDVSTVTTSAIRCIRIEFDTAFDGSGGMPSGMSITGATYDATNSDYIPDAETWTASGNNGTGVVEITNATGETPASASARTVVLTGMTNGSTANTTYYAILSTYNNVNCSSSPVDTTGVATLVFTETVTVNARVAPNLTFTVLCNSGACSSNTLNIPESGAALSSGAVSNNDQLTLATSSNATSGFVMSYNATTTLTSPDTDTISSIGGTPTASSPGTEQYGMNLAANTGFGTAPSGSGCGSTTTDTDYDTANEYAYETHASNFATLVTTAGPSNTCTFTVSHIVNIGGATEAGLYSNTEKYRIVATY